MVQLHQLANLLPPIFVCLLIAVIWSIYVSMHLLPKLQFGSAAAHQVGPQVFMSGFFEFLVSHGFVALMMVAYVRALVTRPGSVPDAWKIGSQGPMPTMHEVKMTGERRYCKWCLHYKPDRCHHCRICKTCVLKMDHHCPWIMNCVGFRNHKFFFLLAFYAMLASVFICVTMAPQVWESPNREMPRVNRFMLVLGFTLTTTVSFILVIFQTFHAWLMLSGLTTIEFCEKATSYRKTTAYGQSLWQNLCAVLGPHPLLWLLPISTPAGNGTAFERTACHGPSGHVASGKDPEDPSTASAQMKAKLAARRSLIEGTSRA